MNKKYFIAIIIGFLGSLLIIGANQFFLPKEIASDGGYYFTNYLQQNYSWSWFVLWGGVLGTITKINPLIAGLSMVIVFPFASILEIISNSNSHNMFPLELFVWVIFALPAILGAWLGKMISERKIKNIVFPISGFALILIGFVYDFIFAGIPYQDPSPKLQSRWEFQQLLASFFYKIGAIILIIWLVARVLIWIKEKKLKVNDWNGGV